MAQKNINLEKNKFAFIRCFFNLKQEYLNEEDLINEIMKICKDKRKVLSPKQTIEEGFNIYKKRKPTVKNILDSLLNDDYINEISLNNKKCFCITPRGKCFYIKNNKEVNKDFALGITPHLICDRAIEKTSLVLNYSGFCEDCKFLTKNGNTYFPEEILNNGEIQKEVFYIIQKKCVREFSIQMLWEIDDKYLLHNINLVLNSPINEFKQININTYSDLSKYDKDVIIKKEIDFIEINETIVS